jgi:hypothetical protein
MVDSHALVGSCAQIGKRVHLSAAAQIGGVLEPVNASPVIIEDDVLVGGNTGVYEGTIVRARAVLAAGVILTRGTPGLRPVQQHHPEGHSRNPAHHPRARRRRPRLPRRSARGNQDVPRRLHADHRQIPRRKDRPVDHRSKKLSNALYQVALDSGCEIVERHRHSRTVPGSATAAGRDATVAWNYVDLRFRPAVDMQLTVELTAGPPRWSPSAPASPTRRPLPARRIAAWTPNQR